MSPGLRLRLVAFYTFAVGSVTLIPWLAVSLVDVGVPGATAALVLLLVPCGHLFAGPLWALVADRTQAPHVVLRASTTLAAVAGALLLAAQTAEAMVVAVVLWAICRAPMFPLADALTLRVLGEARRDYGRIRAIGSLAYLLSMLGGGFLRETWPRAPLWIGLTMLIATALVAWTLPRVQATADRPGPGELARLVVHPALWPVLVVCVLHGATVTAYETLFAMHVEGLGYRAGLVGAAAALGVGLEVVLMLQGRQLIDRFGPLPLFALAVASGVPRWLLTVWAPGPWLLVGAQALHGIHFGLFWIASVALFSERAPPGLAGSVQSLLPASTFGAGYLMSMAAASTILARGGTTTGVFMAATAVSTVATVLALGLAWRSRSTA